MDGTNVEKQINYNVFYKFTGLLLTTFFLLAFVAWWTLLCSAFYTLAALFLVQIVLAPMRPKYRVSMIFQWLSVADLWENVELAFQRGSQATREAIQRVQLNAPLKTALDCGIEFVFLIWTAVTDYVDDLKSLIWPVLTFTYALDQKRKGNSFCFYFTIPTIVISCWIFYDLLYAPLYPLHFNGLFFYIFIVLFISTVFSYLVYFVPPAIKSTEEYIMVIIVCWVIWGFVFLLGFGMYLESCKK